jgi:hypothetical protein
MCSSLYSPVFHLLESGRPAIKAKVQNDVLLANQVCRITELQIPRAEFPGMIWKLCAALAFAVFLQLFSDGCVVHASAHSTPSYNVLFCAVLGTPSHVRPLLEYGQSLRNRGHNVSFAISDDYIKVALPYNATTYSVAGKHQDSIHSVTPEEFLQVDYSPSSLLSMIVLADIKKHIDETHIKLLQVLGRMKANKSLPHVIVSDIASASCFQLADEFGIPSIIASHNLDSWGK